MANFKNKAARQDSLLREELIALIETGSTEPIPLTQLEDVAAGTDGLAGGELQTVLQSLASRIQALEDAAP